MKLRILFHEQSAMTRFREIAGELIGTFLPVPAIFALTEGCKLGRPDNALAPVFVGLMVTVIICLVAPLTQAGLSPARDLGPRLIAWLRGRELRPSPTGSRDSSSCTYWAPLLGGSPAALLFARVLEPLMGTACSTCDCITTETLETGEESR